MNKLKLSALQQKYPKAKHEPHPTCSKCGGEGEFWRDSKIFKPGYQPCMCIFVEPDLLPIARESLQQTLAKIESEVSNADR